MPRNETPSEKTIKIRAMKNVKRVFMKEISDHILLVSKALDSAIDSDYETLFFFMGEICTKFIKDMEDAKDVSQITLSIPPFNGTTIEIPLAEMRTMTPDVYEKLRETTNNFLEVYNQY